MFIDRINTVLSGVWPDWHVDEELGAGSYGAVYRARRDTPEGREQAAIKVIPVPGNEAEVDAFLAEGNNELTAKVYFQEIATGCLDEARLMEGLRDAQCCLDIRETDMEFALAAGNLPEAQRLLEENLEGYTLYRGAGHEDTLHCMEKLADVLLSFPEHSAERTGRAKDLYCRVAAGIHENYPFDVRWLGRVKEKMKGL